MESSEFQNQNRNDSGSNNRPPITAGINDLISLLNSDAYRKKI